MNKQNDPLSQLWQSQPVQTVDPDELQLLWKKNRRKQWLWVLSDVFGLLVGVAVCGYLLFNEENLLRQIWSLTFIVLLMVMTPFLVKLRLGSLGSNIPTNEYMSRLIQQKLNNIRIARLTNWLMVSITIFFAIWSIAFYLYYQPNPDEYLIKVLKRTAFVLLVSGILALWAKREIRKNTAFLKQYKSVQEGSQSPD